MEIKPLEVEILVLEVGEADGTNELYRIAFDGSIADEKGFTGIGGQAEELKLFLKDKFAEGLGLEAALQLAARALEATASQKVKAAHLEVATLERARQGRKFRRIPQAELRTMMDKSGNGGD
jgi:proteasome alpha subunit